jgi:phenolic acid decarboxylase
MGNRKGKEEEVSIVRDTAAKVTRILWAESSGRHVTLEDQRQREYRQSQVGKLIEEDEGGQEIH